MIATTNTGPSQSSGGARLVQSVVTAGAVLLIAASAGLGTYFGWEAGRHVHWLIGVAFAIAALGGELLKPFAMAGAFDALGRWQFGRGLACAAVAVVCIVYSLAGELALSAGSRGDLTAKRESQAKTAKSTSGSIERAEAELAEMANAKKRTRSVDELEVLVANTPARCRVELDLQGGRRTVCAKDAALVAEFGRAKRKAQLEGIVANGLTKGQGSTVGQADPLAAAVAHYAKAAGYAVAPGDLSHWLHLVPVIFIEVCSAFGLVVARAATGPTTVSSPPATVAASVPATLSGSATVAGKLLAPPATPRVGLGDGRYVLDALRLARGPLTNAELASAMGVSPGEASKRRARVAHLIDQARDGREVRVRLLESSG